MKKHEDKLNIKISLSHSKENAIAFVIAMEVTDNE
jgi:phosphopantetheinyl transferase (holo-ACP synthase)